MTLLAFMVLLNDFIYSTSGKRIINSNNSSRPTTTMTMIDACKKLQDDGGGKKLVCLFLRGGQHTIHC